MEVPWLGAGSWHGPEGVSWSATQVDDDVDLVSIRADRDLVGIATGSFTQLSAGFRFSPAGADGVRAVGFGLAEFGLPARTDGTFARWSPLLAHRPASVLPVVVVGPDGSTVLLAPVEGAHEQCFPADEHGPAWGWHGHLDSVPAGFVSSLAVVRGDGPRACFARWGSLLGVSGVDRRYRDTLGRLPSYWTDNGAAYWYRTEPGHTVTSGLGAVVADLRARGVPIGAVQLDSWFYPHEVLRPFDTDEWIVPPTGLLRWEPRPDVLPDGVEAVRAAVGDAPLVTHVRHLSAASPYVDEVPCWVDGDRAHPATPELYERWLDQCVAWGVETFEHDWLVECFTGVRPLRAVAGRAAAWQRGVHDAAVARGRTLQWCMATPADMVLAASLPAVTSVRTSGDRGYLVGPGFLWGWSLLVGAMARALGLVPFNDVFRSGDADVGPVDALLASLSCGPVGIGDALGVADVDVVRPCHRADGLLVKPDVPVAALDECFTTSWPLGRRARLLVGDTWSTHAAGTWRYVVALNPSSDEPVSGVVDVEGLLWDWRAGSFVDVGADGWAVSLPPLGWAYAIVAPLLAGDRVAVVGDPALHATAGDARIGEVHDDGDAVRVTIIGAPGEHVSLAARVDAEPHRIPVTVPDRGWTVVTIAP